MDASLTECDGFHIRDECENTAYVCTQQGGFRMGGVYVQLTAMSAVQTAAHLTLHGRVSTLVSSSASLVRVSTDRLVCI